MDRKVLKSLLERCLIAFLRRVDLHGVLPKTRRGDYWAVLQDFVRAHHRLPGSPTSGLNDHLFRLTTSPECLNPLRAFVTDKEYVKLFVKAKLGDEYNVPTLALHRSLDACVRLGFPRQCVIKPTHLSGEVICRLEGEEIDFSKIGSWFETNYYLRRGGWEANYRHLQPKVIVEPFVFGDTNPNDYKIFCYQGEPKLIQVDFDRRDAHTRVLFDVNWGKQPFSINYPRYEGAIERPFNLETILDVCRILSEDFDSIRIDLYTDGKRILVGELTNCSTGAIGKFLPASGEAVARRLVFGS